MKLKVTKDSKQHGKRNVILNNAPKFRDTLSDVNTITYTSDKFLIPLLKCFEHTENILS